jgi:hypothetical protein
MAGSVNLLETLKTETSGTNTRTAVVLVFYSDKDEVA